MTTDEAIATLEEVGFKVALKDGKPVLLGDRARVTPVMLAMLRWHRQAIVERLSKDPPAAPAARLLAAPPREWLWRYGHTHTETPDDEWLYGHRDRHPSGAWWWRYRGDSRWEPIPGRCDCTPQEMGLREVTV